MPATRPRSQYRQLTIGVIRHTRLTATELGLITKHETELAIAIGHAAEGRLIVDRQRELVATLKARGHPVANHERTLALFEMTLRAFAEHVCLLRREIADELEIEAETHERSPD